MNSLSLRLPNRRMGYMAAAFTLLFAFVVSPLVAADQVTERSIALSSSSANATGVTYKVKFTSVGAAAATVLDFCENTPLYGEDCDTAPGFALTGATVPTTNFTDENVVDANTIRVTGTIGAATAIEFDITGVHNPTNAGPLFARIITFDTAGNANSYVSNPVEPAVNTGVVDTGGVALSITPTIGVSGAVLESLVFCVSGEAIDDIGCTRTDNEVLPAPTVKLGQTVGDTTVLDSAQVYQGTIYTQISTNAVGGAVVSLKSNTVGCGGLSRAGASTFAAGCGIAPALAAGISNGDAKFGVKTGTAAGVSPSTGTVRAFDSGSGAYYNDSTFKLNWVNGDASGVTSTYGDPFLDTNGGPANNMGMPITFGASAANNTPAGRYSADLSLIATGKF